MLTIESATAYAIALFASYEGEPLNVLSAVMVDDVSCPIVEVKGQCGAHFIEMGVWELTSEATGPCLYGEW